MLAFFCSLCYLFFFCFLACACSCSCLFLMVFWLAPHLSQPLFSRPVLPMIFLLGFRSTKKHSKLCFPCDHTAQAGNHAVSNNLQEQHYLEAARL